MVKSRLVSVFLFCLSKEWAKWQNNSSWGPEPLFDIHVDTSAPRGRTLDGGTIWSLGIKVPRGDSSGEGRVAHAPLHPAVNRSLETWMALLFVFLLWSWFGHWLIVSRFCLWGWYIVWLLCPSSPDPYLVFVCVPLLCFVWLFSSTPCFLFSSLSLRRWGNPNPLLGVWGSPCVSSSWTRSPTLIRTSPPSPTPRSPPAPFFFFVVVARFPAWVFSGFLPLWWSVSWLCSWSFSGWLHAR